MQVLLKLNDDELKLMAEEEFEKMKDELDEFDGIHPYIIMGWLHDKKPICNICNNYLDDDSRPVGAQVMPQTFSELIEEYGFIKENIIYYLPYHNSSNCEGRLVVCLLNDNETIRISTTIENGWEATDLFETKNIEDIIYLIKRLTA